jgi:hypothetical protein
MTVQTTVSEQMPLAVEGLGDANPNFPREVYSCVAEGAIPLGRFVKKGTADDQALPISADDDTPIGVALAKGAREPGAYASGEHVPVMSTGFVWVHSETAAAKGGQVFVRAVAGVAGSELGRVRNAAVADETIAIDAANAEFAMTAASAGLVLIKLTHLQ